MIPLFCGYDPRESVGYHKFTASVIRRTAATVSFTPLRSLQRDGSNAFTYSRFLVPYFADYKGFAIFADACDMLCLGDIEDLWSLQDWRYPVQVVKHDYKTSHHRKYVGTEMECANEDYPCKNWSSLMLINCGHPDWRDMEPRRVAQMKGGDLHRFAFLGDVGELPKEWNVLVDEGQSAVEGKLLHWTAGIPHFPHYRSAPYADVWRDEAL